MPALSLTLFPLFCRTVDSDQIYLQTSKSNRDPQSVNAEDVMDAQKNPPITVDNGYTVGGGASPPPPSTSYAARPPEQSKVHQSRGAPSVIAAGGPCGVGLDLAPYTDGSMQIQAIRSGR